MERKLADSIAKGLKQGREDWDGHFGQLADYIHPRRGIFHQDPASHARSRRGDRVNRKMLDSTPRRALRVLQSGMQAGITSPSRPWFRWQASDPALREVPAVKDFIERVTREARVMLQRSGVYNTLHTGYGELGAFGTECTIIEDEETKGLLPTQLVPGTYWLGSSDNRRVDRLYREYLMTVSQIVGKFVYNGDRRSDPDWGAVPSVIKSQYDKGQISELHKVCHLITPRQERDNRRMDGPNKPIASCYWMEDTGPDKLMGNKGYDRNPIFASRWEVEGWEVYGRSPGMDALPDCKELMDKVRDQNEAMKRMLRPPMNAHSDLRNSAFSLLPGSVNFMADPSKGLTPAYDVNPPLDALRMSIQDLRDQIWNGFYADLFMMISQMDRAQITATEINERKEEKLIGIGPVLERQQNEKLEPLLDLTFQRVVETGRAGEIPTELQNAELEVEYISTLAQAQKAVATGGVERLWSFAGNISAVKPDVLDKLDGDQSIDEYAEMLGVPPSIIVADEAVAQKRAAAQQQAQAMQAAEMAPQVAQAAKAGAEASQVLSQADNPRGAAPGDVLRKTGLA